MAQQDPASPQSPPVGETADESASELPAPRGAETLARPRLPGQRPQTGDADEAGPAEADPAEVQPIGTGTEPAEIETEPAEDSAVSRSPGLGARERAVLDFERRRWKHAGAKEQAIRDEFELSATRYYQILNALLDDPAALAYSPALVGRLRRIREARGRARR